MAARCSGFPDFYGGAANRLCGMYPILRPDPMHEHLHAGAAGSTQLPPAGLQPHAFADRHAFAAAQHADLSVAADVFPAATSPAKICRAAAGRRYCLGAVIPATGHHQIAAAAVGPEHPGYPA